MNSKLTKFALTTTLGLAITFTLNACGGGDSIKDSRDGKTYKTVKIGEQVWMAENLNYEASGSKCYDNKPDNCNKYGRLYDWNTAMKACPSGWHLPSDKEWQTLLDFVSGYEVLKASSGWEDYTVCIEEGEDSCNERSEEKSGNGTDNYGFSAMPGGKGSSDGSFSWVGRTGFLWSATESNSDFAGELQIGEEYAFLTPNKYKGSLSSVRCIKD